MKRIAVLGSTGSIGISALNVIKSLPLELEVFALTANTNTVLLEKQIKQFAPFSVAVGESAAASRLKHFSGGKARVFSAEAGLCEIVRDKRIDIVLLAISGRAALEPLLAAIEAGHDIALANKEALVMAGPLIMERARRKNVRILPVDSEQSAIWQCLNGERRSDLRSIYLTASGGPFRKTPLKNLSMVRAKDVLRHPRWKMGKKITVDSATLMNKGLELIEAMHLFDVGPDKIKVVIHPEAIVHSMVEFKDGVVIAQLSETDMRIPIQYALLYPERVANKIKPMDLFKIRSLNFEKPDFKKFPCLGLAYKAAKEQGTLPCVLNAANEESVREFLRGKINFLDICNAVEKVISKHKNVLKPSLNDIKEADLWARRQAQTAIKEICQ